MLSESVDLFTLLNTPGRRRNLQPTGERRTLYHIPEGGIPL
jgi:hypothetical protein